MTRELTDEQINAIWGARDDPMFKSTLSAFGMARIRAIIEADRALRVPMTDKQINDAYGEARVQFEHIPHDDVVRVVRAAERFHGIGEKA